MPIQIVGPVTAKVMVVGEYGSEQDFRRGEPFIAGMGFELTKLLAESGLHRNSCLMTYVMKDRIPQGKIEGIIATKKKFLTPKHVLYKGKMVLPSVVDGIEELRRDIERHKPNVVIALGNLAMWALTEEWGVHDWRSSIMESTLVPGLKVIPSLNPNILGAQWSKRPLLLHDLKRAFRHRDEPRVIRPNYNFVIRPSFERAKQGLLALIERAVSARDNGTILEVAADIETRAGHIACIAFADSALEALCIPLMSSTNPEGYWTLEEEAELVHLIYRLCQLVTIIGQNWNYDAQYLYRHWHFLCPSVVDTMIQQHSCFSNLPKNLSFLSSMYLEDHLHWKDDRTNWTEGPKGEGEDQYWRYNCTDTVRTYAIHQVLNSVVTGMGMGEVNRFQQALAPRVLKTMNRGVRVNHALRAQLSLDIMEEVARREAWLESVLGHTINIKSPLQMRDFFYRQMGQKEVLKRNSEGGMSVTCDDEALRKIAAREPLLFPITKCISELRSLGVFHSTFILAGLDIDGRMRTNFNICGTETYRFASSTNAFGTGMNMQNIPKGNEE